MRFLPPDMLAKAKEKYLNTLEDISWKEWHPSSEDSGNVITDEAKANDCILCNLFLQSVNW